MKRYWMYVVSMLLAVFFCMSAAVGYCADTIKVGIAYECGGNEQNFNALAYQGARQAQREFDGRIEVVALESTMRSTNEGLLNHLISLKCNLVIGVGSSFAESIQKAAALHPRIDFVMVDHAGSVVEEKSNLLNLIFKDQESAYLAGIAAASKSKTGKIGFIGGMDSPVIERFKTGYSAGARSVNPKIVILCDFVGDTLIAFKNSYQAKECALDQIDKGADVIYAPAGFAGIGVIDAATTRNILAIGVDVDQTLTVGDRQKAHLLTSTLKRIDTAVYQAVKNAALGVFSGGTRELGLKEAGVDYALNAYNAGLMQEIQPVLEAAKERIIRGELTVATAE